MLMQDKRTWAREVTEYDLYQYRHVSNEVLDLWASVNDFIASHSDPTYADRASVRGLITHLKKYVGEE